MRCAHTNTPLQPDERFAAVAAGATGSTPLLEASRRTHTKEIVEYILRGPGRKRVPKRIYLAAWELQYALNRESNNPAQTPEGQRPGGCL
jgi:hypothetical protein